MLYNEIQFDTNEDWRDMRESVQKHIFSNINSRVLLLLSLIYAWGKIKKLGRGGGDISEPESQEITKDL